MRWRSALGAVRRQQLKARRRLGRWRHIGWDDTVNFKVTAVCAKRGTYKVVSSGPKRLPDNSQVSATARCPQGAQVTSGGVRITGTDSDLEVAQSFPFDSFDPGHLPDNGWRGSANNQSTGQPQRMETFAVCKT